MSADESVIPDAPLPRALASRAVGKAGMGARVLRCVRVIIEGLLVAFVVGIGLAFLAGGLLLIKSVGGHLWERWAAFFAALESRRWRATMGHVARSVVTYSTFRRGRSYTPAVRYSYGVGDERLVAERFAFTVTEGGGDEGAAAARAVVERFRAGSDVQVFYDPKKPKRATLDRSVPPVVAITLGWLSVLLVGAGVMLSLGVIIVRGPFEDPPNLGEVPSLPAQLGGVAVALGVSFLLVAGVRAASADERRQRRLLRRLESAKSVLAHEVSVGDIVIVAGRAELEGPGVDELPFEAATLAYYDVDAEWFRRTCTTVFGVRDASGVVFVDLGERDSTLLETRRLRLEGDVERWLDEQRDDADDPIPAGPTMLRFECIRNGDDVVVAGRAERESGTLVFRAAAADPTSLLVAAGTREQVTTRLRRRLGRTRALLLSGVGLIVAGALAMMMA